MSQPLLSAERCRVTFGAVVALDGATLHVADAEAVGVVGALGAGKSTMLRCIAGLSPLASGSVRFDGRPLDSLGVDARARLGIIHVPAGGGFFPSLTVRENLVLAQPPAGTPQEVASMTETFPVLGARLTQRAGSLSGGEQRQLAIARGVLGRPRLLLLDEPLLGLSPTTVQRVTALLRELHQRGVAMLIAEERPTEDLHALVDRVAGIRAGSIVAAEDAARPMEPRLGDAEALEHVDVEVVGVPLSVRDRRALQTIAQQRRMTVGEVIAEVVHDHVEAKQEVWR
ncbi:MAG TPA: ATP-binding cassette domain-containing protein [Dehalococcoidia bacterium]|nr:ATP-binding cassette domain-containing protein [Dehalococcoidia bacterium]